MIKPSYDDLKQIAQQIRLKTIECSYQAKTPHIGSALSCVDILTALYWKVLRVDPQQPDDPLRDRFILSKGHAVIAHYVALAMRGFFSVSQLDEYAKPGGNLAEHASPGTVPGLELATGSLGHGLSVGAGLALAAEIRALPYQVVVLLSDGECNEGSVWEAAMFAPAKRLSNLTAVIDFNRWQATGRSDVILALEPIKMKWQSFGWNVIEIDGHRIDKLIDAISSPKLIETAPLVVIAHTIKGKGVSFMEDDNNWHYRIPTTDELEQAQHELEATS